jgi:hypothetical protein
MHNDFDKARIEYGQGEELTSTMWTVGHVAGTDAQFIAVNREFGNFSYKFDDTQSFWKHAIRAGEVPVNGYTRNDNKMELDYVTIVHVPFTKMESDGTVKRLNSHEQYLAAVDAAQTKYRERIAAMGPSAGPA